MAHAMRAGAQEAVKAAPLRTQGGVLTAEQAKARVQAQGKTLKQFATEHGLPYRVVSEVIRGVNKGLFGHGHKAAVALGMKRG